MKRVRLHIAGRVQGVFFRISTQQRAKELNISGYVQNLSDGRVEIVAEGGVQNMESFVAWCHEGPSAAKVLSLQVKNEPISNRFTDFNIH